LGHFVGHGLACTLGGGSAFGSFLGGIVGLALGFLGGDALGLVGGGALGFLGCAGGAGGGARGSFGGGLRRCCCVLLGTLFGVALGLLLGRLGLGRFLGLETGQAFLLL